MKKILFILFTVSCVILHGQNFIANLPSIYPSDNSIVRWYDVNTCILYTQSATQGNYFHLINTVTGDIRSIEIDHEVYDMEILNDTLYYCGNYAVAYALLNFFAIQDMYSSNVTIRWFGFPSLNNVYPRRLEVFRVPGGVHAVVVGDYTAPGSTRTNSFLADLWRCCSPITMWVGKYFYTDDKECYDDIIVTDNYVVASAHVCQGTDIYLRVFDKPTIACFGPSMSYCLNYNIFYYCGSCSGTIFQYFGTDHKKSGAHGEYPIRLAHTTGDKVALACMVEEGMSTGITAKEIEIISGVPSVNQNTRSFTANSIGGYTDLREIRYNPANDSIVILVDANTPSGHRSGYVEVDNATFTPQSITYITFPNSMDYIHSIDWGKSWMDPATGNVLSQIINSGTSTVPGSATELWCRLLRLDGCSESQVVNIKRNTAKMLQRQLPCPVLDIPYESASHYVISVVESSFDPKCGLMENINQ